MKRTFTTLDNLERECEQIDTSRRTFVTGAGIAIASAGLSLPLSSSLAGKPIAQAKMNMLRGKKFELNVEYASVNFTGTSRIATTVNGGVPSPVLRWKEGQRIVLNVHNKLNVDSSIH